mgnify:CR=1 FL=1
MGAGNAGKGDSGQVSGNEAVETAARRGKYNEINKNLNVSTFSERNYKEDSSASKFITTDIPRNKLFKLTPQLFQSGVKIIEGITDAPRKNKEFLIDNYDKIGKNYDLPNKKEFLNKDLKTQQKIYRDMRQDFMRNNKNALGEDIAGGGGYVAPNTQNVIKKNIGGRTIQTTAPTEGEVSQSGGAGTYEGTAALKVKKRGRSASIMTGPRGVTKTSTDYSLGKKSLLGRV